ncbi:MAG: hypothetical protein ACTHK7_15545 [Aureliella sp.]
MTASGITSLYRGGSHWIGQSLDNLVSYWFNGHIAGYAQFQRKLSDAEEAEAFAGPEPINLTAPTGSMSSGTFNGNVGTWDSQSNGTISCAWELRNVTGDVVEASGTAASGADITASASYAGSYYLHVRASNDGGYDPAEDSVSTQFTSDGSTPIPVDTGDSLWLTDTAGINYIFAMSASDSLSLSDMTENSVFRDEASDTFALSESVAVTGDHIINVTETLAITDLFELVIEGDTSDTLAVTDDASSTIAKNYRESATDTLSLSNVASAELDRIALTTTTAEDLAVSDTAWCYVELNVSLEDELVTTETSVDPDTLDIVETETGLADAASAPGTVAGSASDKVNLSGTAAAWVLSPGGIE